MDPGAQEQLMDDVMVSTTISTDQGKWGGHQGQAWRQEVSANAEALP